MKHRTHALPQFFIRGLVTSIYNDGRNAIVEIVEVIGSRNAPFARLLQKEDKEDRLNAVLENPQPACEFDLKTLPSGYQVIDVFPDRSENHRLTEGARCAFLVEFDEQEFNESDPSLGLTFVGWNFYPRYEYLDKKRSAANRAHERKLEEEKRRATLMQNNPFQLMLGNQVLATDSLRKLAAFFEYRAWPKSLDGTPVTWRFLERGGRFVSVDEPAMLGKNDFVHRTNYNSKMDALYETVKEIPMPVADDRRDSRQHQEENHRSYRHQNSNGGGLLGLGNVLDGVKAEVEDKVIQMMPEEKSEAKGPKKGNKPDRRKHKNPKGARTRRQQDAA